MHANLSNSQPEQMPPLARHLRALDSDPRALALDECAALQALAESLAQAGSGDLWRRGLPPPLTVKALRI